MAGILHQDKPARSNHIHNPGKQSIILNFD